METGTVTFVTAIQGVYSTPTGSVHESGPLSVGITKARSLTSLTRWLVYCRGQGPLKKRESFHACPPSPSRRCGAHTFPKTFFATKRPVILRGPGLQWPKNRRPLPSACATRLIFSDRNTHGFVSIRLCIRRRSLPRFNTRRKVTGQPSHSRSLAKRVNSRIARMTPRAFSTSAPESTANANDTGRLPTA
jgi:hypothetical protein